MKIIPNEYLLNFCLDENRLNNNKVLYASFLIGSISFKIYSNLFTNPLFMQER